MTAAAQELALEALHHLADQVEPRPARRGTTNGNARGGSAERRRRREWLVETYRADVDVVTSPDGRVVLGSVPIGDPGLLTPGLVVRAACRCYRCGELLTVDTVTVDRIIPGCKGGTYKRNNIRPACAYCNSSTGGRTRARSS